MGGRKEYRRMLQAVEPQRPLRARPFDRRHLGSRSPALRGRTRSCDPTISPAGAEPAGVSPIRTARKHTSGYFTLSVG